MPTTIILVKPLCTGPEKHVCSLIRLTTRIGGFVTITIHEDWTARHLCQLDDFHTGSNRHIHRDLGDAERFNHVALAFGRRTIMRTHGRNDERLGAFRL